MARGAALSRVSLSKRGVSLSSWAAVRIKRRDWLASKELWHRRACRYVPASCQKGVAQLKALWQAVRQSVVDFHQCLLRNAQTEKRRDRRASEKKKRIAHQASPVTQQLISRAITVAAYTLSLECGHMLALPTWLRIICAYSVAALVPTLLPNAHGDNCRVFTTISASALAATLASPTAAVGVSFVLCLCPTRMLWWPSDEETDTVTSLLREVLKWMDAHDDVLPARHNRPTPQQKEENSLRVKYMHYQQKKIHLTDAQRALQEEIDRRATNQKDLDVLEEVARWSAKNNNRLPVMTKGNKDEFNVAHELRRLQRASNTDFTETPR